MTPVDSGAPRADADGAATAERAEVADAPTTDGRTYAVCLGDTSPTFTNLKTHLFPMSCTSTVGSGCHSMADATKVELRGGGGLDLETDVYSHLLGTDGMGAPANNQEGAAHGLIRVKPRDPDNSFLLIKLQITTNGDNNYGSGMPFTAPGSVCPTTLATIRDWITQGAPDN